MKDKIQKIWGEVCDFFSQPDKQKHFIYGLAICALLTIPLLLQEIPLGLTPAGAMIVPLVAVFTVFVLSVIWELIGSTGFDWYDILSAMVGCVVVWLSAAYGALLWHINMV